jgi:acyl-CoA thioesterase
VCSTWRPEAPAFADAGPPVVAALGDSRPIAPGGLAPPMVGNYQMRVDFDRERRPPSIGGWIRTAEPRPSDHIALAAMTDAFLPPAFFRAGEPVRVPTLELTIHFRGEPPAGEHPWILAGFVSRDAAGGVVEEDGELWSADGVLLARSRQLALMRRRDPARAAGTPA